MVFQWINRIGQPSIFNNGHVIDKHTFLVEPITMSQGTVVFRIICQLIDGLARQTLTSLLSMSRVSVYSMLTLPGRFFEESTLVTG